MSVNRIGGPGSRGPGAQDGSCGAGPVVDASERIVRIARLPVDTPDPGARLAAELGSDLAQVLVFASPQGDFGAISGSLRAAFPGADVAACTTAGEIDGAYLDDEILAQLDALIARGVVESREAAIQLLYSIDAGNIEDFEEGRERFWSRRRCVSRMPRSIQHWQAKTTFGFLWS